MKIISHRGNLSGKDISRENKIFAIVECIDLGFDVEVDLWSLNGELYLGHDEPEIYIESKFLFSNSENLWIHAKNFLAVDWLVSKPLNWFWHKTDEMTLTSKGIPWCYPDNYLSSGITVLSEDIEIPQKVYGICTDNPLRYQHEKFRTNLSINN
jgi:hypothetical protein